MKVIRNLFHNRKIFNRICETLPLGFPSPKMTTLSLGGAVAPGWLKERRK
jgi:hypothetical protein